MVVNMIVEDLLPIATVEQSGFRKLVSFLAPGYTLPARKSIVLRIEAKHNQLTQRAIDEFKSPDIVCVGLTTDLWTSITDKGYIGVTTDFITKDLEMKSFTLQLCTEKMNERHTGENIRQDFLNLPKLGK